MNLTKGERFWLARRRAGRTSAEAAKAHGVKPWDVTEWEKGRGEIPEVELEGEIQPHERSIIARRREGWTQGELAKMMLVSKQTIIKRESGRGRVEGLMEFWNTRGWPEPRVPSPEGREEG